MSFYIALLDLITFLQQFELLSCFKTLQVIGVLPPCYLENRDNNSLKITKRQEFCSCRKTYSGMENPHKHWIYAGFRWRSGWDSNPRYREVQLISSHFSLVIFSGNYAKMEAHNGSQNSAVYCGFRLPFFAFI